MATGSYSSDHHNGSSNSEPVRYGTRGVDEVAEQREFVAEFEDSRVREIEAGENQLIQHIRTAGLQKQRENGLVEEVMELRKLRRQLVVHFRRQQAEARTQRQDILREMARETKMAHDMQQKYEGVILGIKAKAAEQVQFFSAQMQAMETSRQQELKQKQEEMRSTYEQKLKLLEQQIQLLSEKQASEQSRREADVLARIEDERRHWQAKEMQHQQEINNLLTKLAQVQRHTNDVSQQAQHSTQQMREMEARWRNDAAAWQERLKKQAQQNEATMQQVRSAHQEELAAIDEKVRKALHSREQSIQQLKAQLYQREQQLNAAEALLQQLHQGFAHDR